MTRPNIQINDEVREMTEEEHADYLRVTEHGFKVPDVVAD
jgi:hypothetical protein